MPFIEEIKTWKGVYGKDAHGVWHYLPGFGAIGPILEDALVHRPNGSIYFWFERIPAPLFPNDTVDSLNERWKKWKEDYKDPKHYTDRSVIRDLRNKAGVPQDP